MSDVVHFVAYGSYNAPCGQSFTHDPTTPFRASNSWWDRSDYSLIPDRQLVTCPGCVERARREHIYPMPDLPPSWEPGDVEEWLRA